MNNWNPSFQQMNPDAAHRLVCTHAILKILDNLAQGRPISGLVKALAGPVYASAKKDDFLNKEIEKLREEWSWLEASTPKNPDTGKIVRAEQIPYWEEQRDLAFFRIFYDSLYRRNVFRSAAIETDPTAKEYLSDD